MGDIMEQLLAQSCEKILEILKKMRDSGQISGQEYEKHASLKLKFLQSYYNENPKDNTVDKN
jgi:hypothetical protein